MLNAEQEGITPERHYCAPANSDIVRANIPALPENSEVLGYGPTSISDFYGWCYETETSSIGEDAVWAGSIPELIYIRSLAEPVPESIPTPTILAVRQWSVTLGGPEIWERSDIEGSVMQFVASPSNVAPITTALENALRVSDPEALIAEWIDKEPTLLALVEFVPLASTQGIDITAIAESNASISDVITKAAAGVMLRGGFSDHFRYTEDGTLIIDPSSPPTVDQAYELLRRTLEIKETASRLDNYSAWMLGMIADQFETYFGEHFDPSVIMAQTSKAYTTYICSLGTFREWWQDKRNLSYTHHREVKYSKHLDHESGGKVLDISEKFGLNVLQQRKLISYAKRFDVDALQEEVEGETIETIDDLMERIDIRAVTKRYLFFLRTANKWYEYKGPFENIPNGASPIINADTRQIMGQDGRSTKPDEWVPVGVQLTPTRLGQIQEETTVEDPQDEEA